MPREGGRVMGGRWWTYQSERFPLLAHGPLVLAFSACAVAYSALLRGTESVPPWPVVLVAFVSSLISFFHLRVADEFKDVEDDLRWRPYRPVPRGLVTLRELGWLAVGGAVVQLGMAFWLDGFRVATGSADGISVPLWLPLVAIWVYLGLMSREFFVRDWLKAHPFTYMWSHMFIMPLIDFYATACDWVVAGGEPPHGLLWFVVVSFFNGFVIEIGRKIRASEDEEEGVETYSALWGRGRAVAMWGLALGLTWVSAVVAATQVGAGVGVGVGIALGVVGFVAAASGRRFLRGGASGKRFEAMAGVWTLVLYLSLGVVPFLWRALAVPLLGHQT